MAFAMRDKVLAKLTEQFGSEIDTRSGCLLYNGWRTLSPGLLYVMGFNPGGDDKAGLNVIESLLDSKLELPTFSSYDPLHDRWEWREKETLDHPHQKRVRELVALFGIKNISDVFSANAIFARSKNQASLEDAQSLWKKCWPVHQFFMSIVRPQIVLCLGNGRDQSSYALMRTVVLGEETIMGQGRGKSVKRVRAHIDLGSYGYLSDRTIIGIPHPSRFPIASYHQSLSEIVDELRGLLTP